MHVRLENVGGGTSVNGFRFALNPSYVSGFSTMTISGVPVEFDLEAGESLYI